MRSRVPLIAFLAAACAAAATPVFPRQSTSVSATTSFPGWPASFEDRPITELPLTPREAAFNRDFPGRIGRFSDGRREIILRWVGAPTRRLHPASDCFKASGYTINPLPLSKSPDGTDMGCFRAERGGESLRVCEAIRQDGADRRTWSDASSWYWDALLGSAAGPWWSVVVAEKSGA